MWVQERIRNGGAKVAKVPGKENPADVMTKHVDTATLASHMTRIDIFPEKDEPPLHLSLQRTSMMA